MADQLATPAELASALQVDEVDNSTATLLLAACTAVVQEAAGNQRLVQVTDTVTLLGTTDSWLDLPQIPVTAVISVSMDGTALAVTTDYKVVGNRLWRKYGWQKNYGWPFDLAYDKWGGYPPPSVSVGYPYQEPSAIAVANTHGYATGAQDLELAKGVALGIAKNIYENPGGATSVRIDDYSAAYEAAAARLEASPYLRAALRRKYGRRGGLVRIG